MKKNIDKSTVISVLFVIAIAILIANLIFENSSSGNGNKIKGEEISGKIINEDFLTGLDNLGIEDDWIEQKTVSKDSSLFIYNVSIPEDLPIPLVIGEIVSILPEKNVDVSVIEKNVNGRTVFQISSGENEKLKAELNYNKEIFRDAGEIGFLIKDFFSLDKEMQLELLNFPEVYAIQFIPSKNNKDFADSLIDYKKEFVILFNDDINELAYKLTPDMSDERMVPVVKTILNDFSSTIFFIIDNESDLFNSKVHNYIKQNFEKQNIKLYNSNSFINITGKSDEEIINLFRNVVKNVSQDEKELLKVSAEDYFLLRPELIKLRKKGYKFVNPSVIVKD